LRGRWDGFEKRDNHSNSRERKKKERKEMAIDIAACRERNNPKRQSSTGNTPVFVS
jgi:hypothetical protein